MRRTGEHSKSLSDGENFYNSLLKTNLVLHNDTSQTYIQPQNNYASNIDLIFSSNNISHKLNVNIHIDTWGSDHFPIFITIDLEKFIHMKKCFKIKSVRTNWESVEQDLNDNIEKLYSNVYRKNTTYLPILPILSPTL